MVTASNTDSVGSGNRYLPRGDKENALSATITGNMSR